MNWLIYTAASVLSDSSRIYIDNYISDYYYKGKGAASQKYFYAIAFIILAVVLFIVGVANSSLSLSLSLSLGCAYRRPGAILCFGPDY